MCIGSIPVISRQPNVLLPAAVTDERNACACLRPSISSGLRHQQACGAQPTWMQFLKFDQLSQPDIEG
jgi:hypothetical protein